MNESKKCNTLVREPPRTTWPPAWLASPIATPAAATPPRIEAEPIAPRDDAPAKVTRVPLATVDPAEQRFIEDICDTAVLLAQEAERRHGPPGEPWPEELVRQWLADTESEYVAPAEWLRSRK